MIPRKRLTVKMAASVAEESEVVTTLSVILGISRELIAQLATKHEDATVFLRKVKQMFDEYSSKEEKIRSDMATLRRARVDAGLYFFPFNVIKILITFPCIAPFGFDLLFQLKYVWEL